jgi:biotin carboxyl carrier protein
LPAISIRLYSPVKNTHSTVIDWLTHCAFCFYGIPQLLKLQQNTAPMPANDAYKILVNGFTFYFTRADLDTLDLVATSPTTFNGIKDHRSVNARVVTADLLNKAFTIETGGETFEIMIKDQLDQQLEQMGFGTSTGKQIKQVKAPMPGLVLEIAVTDGQSVKEGDRLLILEAMKMENSLLIHADATIKKVMVTAGEAVEKGQVLIELE